jgi:L-ascorbate metabolism protein UlaG (beta-lactamase superfamily)
VSRGRAARWVAVVAVALGPGWSVSEAPGASGAGFVQPRDAEGRFVNLDGNGVRGSFGDLLRWRFGERRQTPDRAPVPVVAPDLAALATPPARGEGARITWIGHSTFLVQLDGKTFVTDPILGEIWPGVLLPKRNVPPGVPPEAFPHVDAALVSHDHYDHLDVPTLRRIGAPVIAGLGTKRLLRSQELFVTELGWWRSTRVGDVTVTFVPAQHFGRRGLGDGNQRLWGGFVLQGRSATIYFAGDTAWFDGFREIGRRFPGIDAALLPIGAYDPEWFMQRAHVNPEQALAAFRDLGATTFFAMHWGTFKQTDEPLDEPPRRLEAERARLGLPPERVRVLAVGESARVPAAEVALDLAPPRR